MNNSEKLLEIGIKAEDNGKVVSYFYHDEFPEILERISILDLDIENDVLEDEIADYESLADDEAEGRHYYYG